MTKLTVEWDYDPEDDTQRSATSERFFAAWVNQFGLVEWTAAPEADWAPFVDIAEWPIAECGWQHREGICDNPRHYGIDEEKHTYDPQ